jgi:hypothetical protein
VLDRIDSDDACDAGMPSVPTPFLAPSLSHSHLSAATPDQLAAWRRSAARLVWWELEHSSASPSLADILDVYGAAGCPPRLRAVRSLLLFCSAFVFVALRCC